MRFRARAAGVVLTLVVFASSGKAADLRLVNAVKNSDRAAVSSLLQQRVDVNSPEPDGTTALHWAVRADDLDTADRLIKAGANVKAVNRYGVTPLYLASVNGNAPMIEKLLKAGADANEVTTEGETALMTAARTGNVDSAKVLLANGAKVDSRETWQGQTALLWAVAQKHPDMVKELIAHGADVNARSATKIWERQNSAEPREKWMPLGSQTPLMFAAREGCAACVPILAAAGAQLDAKDIDDELTPLIMHRRRQRHLPDCILDRINCISQGHARSDVERERHRRKLALMIDALSRVAHLVLGDGTE